MANERNVVYSMGGISHGVPERAAAHHFFASLLGPRPPFFAALQLASNQMVAGGGGEENTGPDPPHDLSDDVPLAEGRLPLPSWP